MREFFRAFRRKLGVIELLVETVYFSLDRLLRKSRLKEHLHKVAFASLFYSATALLF